MADVDSYQDIDLTTCSIDQAIGLLSNRGDRPEKIPDQVRVTFNPCPVTEEPSPEQHQSTLFEVCGDNRVIEVAALRPLERDGAGRGEAARLGDKRAATV